MILKTDNYSYNARSTISRLIFDFIWDSIVLHPDLRLIYLQNNIITMFLTKKNATLTNKNKTAGKRKPLAGNSTIIQDGKMTRNQAVSHNPHQQ